MIHYLEECYRLGIESPIVSPGHGSLVGEVDQPSLFEDLGADAFGLFDTLDQPLNGDVGLSGAGVRVEGGGGDDGGAGGGGGGFGQDDVVRGMASATVAVGVVVTFITVGVNTVVVAALPLLHF